MSLRLAREYKRKGLLSKSSHFYELSITGLEGKELSVALFEWYFSSCDYLRIV